MGKYFFDRIWKRLSYFSFQDFVRKIFFIILLGSSVFLCVRLVKPIGNENNTGSYSDLLLFISSAIMTWLISAWYSTFSSSDKIDTVAEQSFDKMRNVTVQIGQVQTYLVNSIADSKRRASVEGDKEGRFLLEHRMDGLVEMLRLISTSNEAVSEDWLGVVSVPVRRRLTDKMEDLNNFTSAIDDARFPEDGKKSNKNSFGDIPGAQRIVKAATRGTVSNLDPAAEIFHEATPLGTAFHQSGVLKIKVLRNTFYATGSGKFSPQLNAIPSMKEIKLISCPAGVDEARISNNFGVGTRFDFNVNLRSKDYSVPLVLGEYVFEYTVSCDHTESG